MKQFFIFVGGMITGAFLLVFTGMQATPQRDNGLTLFEKPGDCITKEPIKVFQVLEQDFALATERSDREYNWYNGKVVLVTNKDGKTYYDEQIVKAKTCFRQIGTYKYQTKNQDWKTVPVVEAE